MIPLRCLKTQGREVYRLQERNLKAQNVLMEYVPRKMKWYTKEEVELTNTVAKAHAAPVAVMLTSSERAVSVPYPITGYLDKPLAPTQIAYLVAVFAEIG